MSNHKAKLADKDFCNWIKAHLAISVTKAGLEDCVCTKLQTIHRAVLNDILTDDQIRNYFCCFGCTTHTIIPCSRIHPCSRVSKVCPFHKHIKYRECPDGICNKIRDQIIQAHIHKTPSWKNTRADAWCKSYWEYAKCFMASDGYLDKNTYFETDFNGIINIVIHHSAFSKIDSSICKQTRTIVNGVRHNSDLSVGDQQLEDIVKVLQQFLSCEEFKNSSQASQAILKLDDLKDNSISVTEGGVKHCLQNQYDDLVKEFKGDIIQFNKDQHGTTPLSPVLEEADSPLLELYVPTEIARVQTGITNRRTTPVGTLRDIFFGRYDRYREIYLCADTGLGKTVYGKRLALMWCQANDPDQNECNFSLEEIDVMKSFGFVFFISLKESDQIHVDVDDMIEHQIIRNLARASSYSKEFIEKVLTNENCLIILDGLDEWSHATEQIPHRKSRQTCTFLTTTRPWKFTIAKIKQSKIDQQLEMTGIDAAGKQKLLSMVLKNIMGDEAEYDTVRQLKNFETEVTKRKIVEFETSPMLLLYLICLWLDEKPLGDSRCSLYSNIVEMLIQKFAKRQQILPGLTEETKHIPECFKRNEHCCKYFVFVKALSYLAFITMFNKQTENKYVFADTIVKENMSGLCIEFWLKTGIITQIKGRKRLTKHDIRVSFIHKTFHEFFAALHLALSEPDNVTDVVEQVCPDMNAAFQNASFLEFLCGLSSTTSSKILNSLVARQSSDDLTQSLRNNTYAFLDYWEICYLKQDFQELMVACVNESKDNGYIPKYRLEDIFLNFESEPETRYVDALRDLTEHKNVKSIKFGRALAPREVHELRKHLNVQGMTCLQKLDLWGHPDTKDVEILLSTSPKTLKCLLLHGCHILGHRDDEKHIEISETSFGSLQTLDNLDSIDVFRIKLKHDLIQKLFEWLEGRKCMKQIKIARVKCLDHLDNKCNSGDLIFDLSRHGHLDIVGLGNMCVADVKINSLILREFWAECSESIVTSFLTSYAPSASNLHTFVVEFIDTKAVINRILDTLPHFDSLCHLQLKGMDLQERELKLTDQHTVRHIRLIEINMESRALKALIEELEEYSDSVTVEMASCVVGQDKDDENICFEKIRDKILLSDNHFTVIANLRCSGHDNAFAFRTVNVR